MKLQSVFMLMLIAFCFTFVASADDWPQWRGAGLDSASTEKNLPDSLNDEHRLWKLELPGPGGCSPVIWKDQIFVASVDGDSLVLMKITKDGKIEWSRKLAGANRNVRMDRANSASPSPVTDGKHVWVMMTDGILHCFDLAGDLKWKKDMQQEYGEFEIQFGMTSTPILDDGKLYFQFIHGNMHNRETTSTGKIVALNATDGTQIWLNERRTDATAENKHSYTTPTIYRNEKTAFLIVHGADFTTGHSLSDGRELWRIGGMNPRDSYNPFLRFVSSPVCSKSMIVVPSAKNGPVYALNPKISGTIGDERDQAILWTLDKGTPDVATPVISNKYVFLARENGVVICLDAKTGEKYFEERLLTNRHRSTPVIADGKIYVVGRDGTAIVIADDREFKLISKNKLGEDTTASPAVSNGRIYIRTNKSLIAFGKKS